MSNYQWSVSAGGTITSGSGSNSILVTWSTVGTQSVSVNYTNSNGCSAATPTVFSVTVGNMPSPTLTGSNDLCENSGFYNYSTETGMSNYSWNISPGGTITWGAGTPQVQVTWNSAGARWISVNYTNPSGCTGVTPTQLNVTVNPLPGAAGPIIGSQSVCQGVTGVAYMVGPVPNAVTYLWTVTAGATIASGVGTNSITVDFSQAAQSGAITVAGNNLCGDGAVSPAFPVTVNTIPPTPVVSAANDTVASSAPSGNQWYFTSTPGGTGSAIPGATGQEYIAMQTGWYWSVVSLNGCSSDASNRVYVVVVGMAELTAGSLTVYPVPNDGKFSVRFSGITAGKATITIFNNLGMMIHEVEAFDVRGTTEKGIDLRTVPNGVYTMMVQTRSEKFIRKIIVRK